MELVSEILIQSIMHINLLLWLIHTKNLYSDGDELSVI